MAKKNLHPNWYNTKVYCEGQLVLEVGGTKKELTVEIWSGNHSLYRKYLSEKNTSSFNENNSSQKKT